MPARAGTVWTNSPAAISASQPITFSDVAGTGKAKVTFDRVPLDKATAYAAEDADVTLRLWRMMKPRLVAERRVTVYETLERPLIPVIARMESGGNPASTANMLSRLSGDFSQILVRLEEEIQEDAGERFQVSSPKQIRRHPVRQDGTARREEDAVRPVGRRPPPCWRNWPRPGTNCRRRSSNGASSPS